MTPTRPSDIHHVTAVMPAAQPSHADPRDVASGA